MEYVILGLLIVKDQTIYQLFQSFRRGISLFYAASYGSLQAATKKIVVKNWARVKEATVNGRRLKFYVIKDAGKVAFSSWMDEKEIPRTKLETICLAKVYFLGLLPEKEQKEMVVSNIIEQIIQSKEDLERIEADVNQLKIPENYQPVFRYQRLTLDYGKQAINFRCNGSNNCWNRFDYPEKK